MRKTLIWLSLAAAAVTPASAQEWSGVYLGGGFGYSKSDSGLPDNVISRNGVVQFRNELLPGSDTVGHVLAGYNWQAGRFIYGLEGEAQIGSFDYDAPFDFKGGLPSCSELCGNFTYSGSFRTYGRARLIAGYEITPRIMGFVAAGVAVGRLKLDGSYGNIYDPQIGGGGGGGPLAYNDRVFGVSLGAGVEVKATSHLGFRTEVLYDRFAKADKLNPGGGGVMNGNNTLLNEFAGGSPEYSNVTARASVIWRF